MSRTRTLLPALAAALLLGIVPAIADARPYVRGTSSATTGAGTASTIAVNLPAGAVAGDLVVVFVAAEGNGALGAAPTGWTSVHQGQSHSGFDGIYRRIVAPGDATTTFSLGTTRRATLSAVAYAAVNTTTPLVTPVTTASAQSSASLVAPSITTTTANSLVVQALSTMNASIATPPAGVDSRTSATDPWGAGTFRTYGYEFVQASAGATGTRTYGLSGTADSWGAVTLAINPAPAALTFVEPPNVPAMPSVTLNGRAQTATAQMPAFTVSDTGGINGWNLTVAGDGAAGKSAVFKAYCPNATCGAHSGPGYVTGGATLPANSLRLTSTGATWTGLNPSAPSLECAAGCNVDSSSPVKVASADPGEGQGPWTASGFSASSLALSVPTTLRVLEPAEVYRADLLWTLSSGP